MSREFGCREVTAGLLSAVRCKRGTERGEEGAGSSRKAIFVLIKSLERKHGLDGGSLAAGLRRWAGSAGNRFSSKAEEMMLDLLNGQGKREEREREVFVQTAKSAGGESE